MAKPKTWIEFSRSIRSVVASALLISETLEAVLAEDKKLLRTIKKEHRTNLAIPKLIRAASKLNKNIIGRMAVRRLADDYYKESLWATDDITLRRAYVIYLKGELAKVLPELSARLALA